MSFEVGIDCQRHRAAGPVVAANRCRNRCRQSSAASLPSSYPSKRIPWRGRPVDHTVFPHRVARCGISFNGVAAGSSLAARQRVTAGTH
jgi:hypothetical protein